MTWIAGEGVIVNAAQLAAFAVQVLPDNVQHPDLAGDERLSQLVAVSPTGAGWEMAKGSRRDMLRRLDGLLVLLGDEAAVTRFLGDTPIVPLEDPDGGRRAD